MVTESKEAVKERMRRYRENKKKTRPVVAPSKEITEKVISPQPSPAWLQLLGALEKRVSSLEGRLLLLESVPESQGVGSLAKKVKESKEDTSSLFDRVVAEKERRMKG